MDGTSMAMPTGEPARSSWLHGEPALEDLLRDPMLRTLMRSDGVDPDGFRDFLDELRRKGR
jgi:hypothetical protein